MEVLISNNECNVLNGIKLTFLFTLFLLQISPWFLYKHTFSLDYISTEQCNDDVSDPNFCELMPISEQNLCSFY